MKICLNCGGSFVGHFNSKHCSTVCKNRFNNAKRPSKRDNSKWDNAEKRTERRGKYREKHKALEICKYCSEPSVHGKRCAKHQEKANALEKISKYRQRYKALWEHKILLNELNSTIKEI